MLIDGRQMHIQITKGDIGRYVILPGDPARCEKLTSEMETAALMIVAQVLHVRCGAVLNVLWNADNDDAPAIPPDATERGVKAAVEAIRVLIREDSKA